MEKNGERRFRFIFSRLSAIRCLDKTKETRVLFFRKCWSCSLVSRLSRSSFQIAGLLDLRLENRKRRTSCEKTGLLRFRIGEGGQAEVCANHVCRYPTTLSPADLENLENLRVEKTFLVRLGDTIIFPRLPRDRGFFLTRFHRDLFQ